MDESENVIPVHHFVRAEGYSDVPNGPFEDPVSPGSDDGDPLVSSIYGALVDEGTAPDEEDGDPGRPNPAYATA